MTSIEKRLQMFLYLLMRDKLPMADVVEPLNAVVETADRKVEFSAQPLAVQAAELVQRLIHEPNAMTKVSQVPFCRDDNGMTVGKLRKWLSMFPDDGEVWLTNYSNGLTNVCVEAAPLNREDVLLSPREKPKCQCDFETVSSGKDGTVRMCRKCGSTTMG